MKIVEALKSSYGQLYVGNNDRWLVFDDFYDTFVVYGHKKYAKKTTIIIETGNEDEAVETLMNE